MKARIAAVSALALLAVTGCGGSDVSSEQARGIVVNGLIGAGQPPDVAECAADAALDKHSPGELVNTSGTTSDAVNASVAAIIADCAAALAPPTTPAPTTTVPDTTVPPTSEPAGPLDPAACASAHDVLVIVDAAQAMDDPGPAAYEGWLDEARDRTELAVLTAPDGGLRDLHMSLRSAVEEFREIAEANGYDSSAADGGGADAVAGEIDARAAELRELVAAGCDDVDVDDTTDAEALAAELMALDEAAPPTTTGGSTPGTAPDDIAVEHAASGIIVDVPAGWTGETGGVADTKYGPATRFLVRGPDPAVFDEGRFDGTGTSIHALDGTIDFNAMLALTGPAQSCTLAGETSYDDGVYVGVRREYTDCGGTPVSIVVVGATDDAAQVSTVVEIRAASLDDRAIDLVLNSFYV